MFVFEENVQKIRQWTVTLVYISESRDWNSL